MEFTPLFVLVGIVLTSGFIAYVCDIVGKKLGKKRLSLFGLRPRHTAAIGTVLVGAVISMTSICLMIVGSKDAREWIIQGGTAMRNLRIVQQQKTETEQQFKETRQQLAVGDQKIKAQELKQADLQGKVASFLKKLSTANLQLAEKTRSLGFVTKEYSDVSASLQKKTDQYNDIAKQSAKNSANYRQTLADRNQTLADRNESIARLDARRDALQAQETMLQGQVTSLSAQVLEMTDQLTAMRTEVDKTQSQKNDMFFSLIGPSRYGPMIYKYQQEVARIDLPSNLTDEQATEAVNTLLARARIEASQHGAEARRDVKANKDYNVADVMALDDGTTAEQRLQQVVAALAKNPEPIVLMARASLNTF